MERLRSKLKTFGVRDKDKLHLITAPYKGMPYNKVEKKLFEKFDKSFLSKYGKLVSSQNSIKRRIATLTNVVMEAFFSYVVDQAIEGNIYKSKYLTINVAEVEVIGYIPQTNLHSNFKTFRVSVKENIGHKQFYFVISKEKKEKLRQNIEKKEYYNKYQKL